MTKNNPWIDTHVHLFPTPAEGTPVMPHHGNRPNTPEVYLQELGVDAPAGIVVVHFSKAPDSTHVIGALDELKGRHPAVGIIKADVKDPRTFEWIRRTDVRGVRVYAKEAMPDFSDKAAWDRLWNLVRSERKHILLFGEAPYLLPTLAQLPQDIPVLIDHLGLPNVEQGVNEHGWTRLLALARSRNRTAAPVYFKGPGYRTSISPTKVQPFVNAIVKALGPEYLLLGASDAPFGGNATEKDVRYQDKPLGQFATLHWMRQYTRGLAERAVQDSNLDAQAANAMLYANAARLYQER